MLTNIYSRYTTFPWLYIDFKRKRRFFRLIMSSSGVSISRHCGYIGAVVTKYAVSWIMDFRNFTNKLTFFSLFSGACHCFELEIPYFAAFHQNRDAYIFCAITCMLHWLFFHSSVFLIDHCQFIVRPDEEKLHICFPCRNDLLNGKFGFFGQFSLNRNGSISGWLYWRLLLPVICPSIWSVRLDKLAIFRLFWDWNKFEIFLFCRHGCLYSSCRFANFSLSHLFSNFG